MAVLISDDFNRADSSSIGGGWTDNADSGDHAQISGNRLRFRWVSQPFGGVSHGGYRSISQHNDIKIEFDWEVDAGATVDGLLPEVRVRSDGTGENGYGMAVGYVPQTDDMYLYVFDGGTVRASTLFYNTVSTGTLHKFECTIDSNNWVEIRVWRPPLSESRPATASLAFNNSGVPYTPTASGSNLLLNAFHGSAANFSVTTYVDNFTVSTLTDGSGSRLMMMGIGS